MRRRRRREEGECLKVEEVDGDKEYGGEECVCREEGNTVTHYTLFSGAVTGS